MRSDQLGSAFAGGGHSEIPPHMLPNLRSPGMALLKGNPCPALLRGNPECRSTNVKDHKIDFGKL